MTSFKTNNLSKIILILAIGWACQNCTEPFEPKTETFESALVIEATITNELKAHEILLSRTFRFEEDGPITESGASVSITDDTQNTYLFEETAPGTYSATAPFAAEPNREYVLSVTTNDGRAYTSTPTRLTATTQIDNMYAERITNDNGVEGMAIFVDSFDPSGNSQYYRYKYEETYRIIAPRWGPSDLFLDTTVPCGVKIERRQTEERTCYTTDLSNSIIITSTNSFTEDRVTRFPVRFINRNNYIMSHRYTILVKQFVQSPEAFTFFETLRDFSGSESLFSETQPGFFAGNVTSVDNRDEKVLGYFDIASVVERRLFFNYADFFPGEDLPPYIDPCNDSAPPLVSRSGSCVLSVFVANNQIRYLTSNDDAGLGEGPHKVVPRVCGDCTVLGAIEVPEFWVE
ncbi:DUF4249 domain-containing protein [Spongiimicrobium sp. 3-5]|uniref:DUF4249 domain-containing protein n=1 Tax=Spongiimicrobium sp. 3-5 TaxID=3332596 RepID=UPI00397F651A